MSAVDRRSSGRKVRLDATLKAEILKDNAAGMGLDEIASKHDIHAEYVRRVVKKAITDSQKTPVKSAEQRDVDSTPAPSSRSGKKQKTSQPDYDENENRTPRIKRSGKKRKAETDVPDSDRTNDVEMADLEIITFPVPPSTRRSLMNSLTEVATVRKADQSCLATAETAEACLSPHRPVTMRDTAVQTMKFVVYEQEYIDFLEESHEQAIKSKDEELEEQSNKIASLNQKVQRLEADLRKERERAVLEKGWKKNF